MTEIAPPATIAMFPLPDHVLLPGIPRPYHIFEPRYRTMIEDLLALEEHERWIAIPCLVHGRERDPEPRPFHDVAAAGLLVAHDKLPDGRYNVIVYPMERCHLVEAASDKPYRTAKVNVLRDEEPRDPSFSLSAAVDTLVQLSHQVVAHLSGPRAEQLRLVTDRESPPLFVDRLGALLLDDAPDRLSFLRARSIDLRVEMLYEVMMKLISGPDTGGVDRPVGLA